MVKKKKKKEKAEPLIGIGLPVADMVSPTAYYNHLAAIAAWKSQFKLELIGVCGCKITRARNVIASAAMRQHCTHLLFVDSDHIVPGNMLKLLMENGDAAMVSGLIHKRYYPYEQVAFAFDKEGKLQPALLKDKTVVKVDACAMGCTLINLEKLHLINMPYFVDGYFRHDINLCLKFKTELGARVLVDTRIHLGHVGMSEIVYPENVGLLRRRFNETVIPTTCVIPEGRTDG